MFETHDEANGGLIVGTVTLLSPRSMIDDSVMTRVMGLSTRISTLLVYRRSYPINSRSSAYLGSSHADSVLPSSNAESAISEPLLINFRGQYL